MSNNRNLFLIAVLVVVILGGWFIFKNQKSASMQNPAPAPVTNTESSPLPQANKEGTNGATMTQTEVKITPAGFEPATITIKAGDTVTWKNVDAQMHDVSSAPHPTHTTYPPLNLGNISPTMSKSLAFPTPGTYKYHDHLTPSLRGTVVVQ